MSSEITFKVRLMSELAAENKTPEYLFWVGSAGSYDERAKKITRAFAKILLHCQVDFAILGIEESDSGDVARRAGNEFLFQMQAMQNIETFRMYQVKKIITCCPHDYNTFKNEYVDYGFHGEIYHHTEFIENLIKQGKLILKGTENRKKVVTYHDPCYLGRGNGIYAPPRKVLAGTGNQIKEMVRTKSKSLCCGAGGAQIFKEPEKGNLEVYALRTQDILQVGPDIVATSCPFCMLMLTDGIKMAGKQDNIKVLDIAELIINMLHDN
jgi:heterodisulfide reductase subunit D